MDFCIAARDAVSLCTRAFNAREALPERVTLGGRMLDTGHFLRSLMSSSVGGEIGIAIFLRDCSGQQPWQLGPQAQQLADAAEREGLLAPAPAASATPSVHPFDVRRNLDRDPVARLRAAGISASYVKPPGPEVYVPPRLSRVPVEREFDPNGAAFARMNTAENITACKAADPATLARQSAEAANAEADRARLAEIHGIRADKARGGGLFDRAAFRAQGEGETAKA